MGHGLLTGFPSVIPPRGMGLTRRYPRLGGVRRIRRVGPGRMGITGRGSPGKGRTSRGRRSPRWHLMSAHPVERDGLALEDYGHQDDPRQKHGDAEGEDLKGLFLGKAAVLLRKGEGHDDELDRQDDEKIAKDQSVYLQKISGQRHGPTQTAFLLIRYGNAP